MLTSEFAHAAVPKKTIAETEIEAGSLGEEPAERAIRPRLTILSQHSRDAVAIFDEDLDATTFRWLLRCRVTDQIAELPLELLDLILASAAHFDSDRAVIVSGYRSQKLNEMLRKKGRNVARESQHVRGRAIDFRLRGVSGRRLGRWARRHHTSGGVGTYPRGGFVHVDTGPPRTWRGR